MLLVGSCGILIAIVVHAMLGLSRWVWPPIGALIRIVCVIAILALGAFGIFTAQQAQRDGWTSIFLLGTFFTALAVLLLFRFYRTRPRNRVVNGLEAVGSVASSSAADAWLELSQHMSWSQRRRSTESRQRIDAFLVEQESPSLSLDHRQLVVTLKDRLPQLTEECLARCRQATSAERREYLDRLCTTLNSLAQAAEVARRNIRAEDDRKLESLHGYFANVSESSS